MATVHGDDIPIGGQRTAVEFPIKMISKKYEIRKQVLGGDPGLEKSRRILNRVIECDRDGITIGADQRHVREILRGLELERANHSATPCDVARRDESKEEDQCRRGQTKHRWDDANDDDDKDRPRISYLSPDRPDLKFASMRVCCAMANPSMRDMECVEDWQVPRRQAKSEVLVPLATEW